MHFSELVIWSVFQPGEGAGKVFIPFISGQSLARSFYQTQYSFHPNQCLRQWDKSESKELAGILNMGSNHANTFPCYVSKAFVENYPQGEEKGRSHCGTGWRKIPCEQCEMLTVREKKGGIHVTPLRVPVGFEGW